ncbi:hypothetical protein AWB81_06658 [Caballeronia arationis]|nr:hypothetical protein AWB81_06658 [Caballeronia arationis]
MHQKPQLARSDRDAVAGAQRISPRAVAVTPHVDVFEHHQCVTLGPIVRESPWKTRSDDP